MIKTKLLFEKDNYLKHFYATVIKSGPKFVILDKTAFYPEGGGQPGDIGILVVEGNKIKVIKVIKRGNQVFHYLDNNISEGKTVHGTIDWGLRFWNMRRHSGEHLLTGLFEESNSGPKVFSSLEQLDFKPSNLDEVTIRNVAFQFNSLVDADIPICIYYTSRKQLDIGNDERKKLFLKKIHRDMDTIRMVKIGKHALTFCMGTHVKSTGEIGKLKSIRLESKKKNRKIVFFELIP
jgi:Ser-tRNA(Ala) deacylase AlaX